MKPTSLRITSLLNSGGVKQRDSFGDTAVCILAISLERTKYLRHQDDEILPIGSLFSFGPPILFA